MKNILTLSCIAFLMVGCTPSAPSAENSKSEERQSIVVATSFYPLTHFVEQVAGDLVEVHQISAPGADPHSYEPSPQQLQTVYGADLFIFNGEGQDPWAERLESELAENGVQILKATELVDRMEYEDDEHGHDEDEDENDDHHEDHDDHNEHDDHDDHDEHDDHHDDEGEDDDHHDEEHHDHAHGEWDPHVWLDPVRAEEIVRMIAVKLSKIDSSNASTYTRNSNTYTAELRALNQEMQAGLSGCELDAVIVSHDAFRYLGDSYDFHTLEIAGLSPSIEPSPARLAELTEIAEKEGIKHIFFETHVSPRLSNTLAKEIGAQTLVLHPIAALTEEERSNNMTYISLQRQNLENLQIALQCNE